MPLVIVVPWSIARAMEGKYLKEMIQISPNHDKTQNYMRISGPVSSII